MPAFVGLDLAWTPHHETGVCVLRGDSDVVSLERLECHIKTPVEFAEMCRSLGENVVVAIDAPLVVEPERQAERELGRAFGKYRAGAYSANLPFLTKMNGLAGPNLARELCARGFSVVPSALWRRTAGRVAMEVFPHPAHVVLFGLEERLKYKKGLVADRRVAMATYQHHLRSLLARELPRVAEQLAKLGVLAESAAAVGGKQLKALEDRLDAVTCAYVGYHCWKHGPDGYRVFGCDDHGAIVTPLLVPATSDPARSSP